MDILAIGKTKWRGRGAKDVEGYEVVYSGIETDWAGRAWLLSSQRKWHGMWRSGDERIVVARLQIEGRWITYISVYAPTDDSSQKIKDGYYKSYRVC